MSDDEHHFESKADAGASKTFPQQAGTIRKGAYLVIKQRPCKVRSWMSRFLLWCGDSVVRIVRCHEGNALDGVALVARVFLRVVLEDVCEVISVGV
jgi:hypothetical protein